MKTFITNSIITLIILSILFAVVACGTTNGNSEPRVKLIDIKLTDEQYAFVCKKGNNELVESMNAFMAKIKHDGTFDALVSKYFEGIGEKVGYEVSTTDIENTADKFIVVTNCPFEPFEYMDVDGKIYGLDIEIAAAYAQAHGLELVIKNIGFDEIFVQVEAGYADIGMAGITASPDRAEIYDFTTPYYEASQKLIVPHGNTDFDACTTAAEVEAVLASLVGKSIGFQNATTGSLYINGDADWGFDGFKNINGKAYANAQIAVSDLLNGNLYAVILDEAPANSIVNAVNAQ